MGALGALIAAAPGAPDPALLAQMKGMQDKMTRSGRASGAELLAALLLMSSHRLLSFL
jgi:hypothetical protein